MADKELDKRSFENLVLFYHDELLLLYNGVRARELFPKGLRKRLREYGVLIYKNGRSGLRHLLSSAALEILNTIKPIPN
jgi:hypothetical protein